MKSKMLSLALGGLLSVVSSMSFAQAVSNVSVDAPAVKGMGKAPAVVMVQGGNFYLAQKGHWLAVFTGHDAASVTKMLDAPDKLKAAASTVGSEGVMIPKTGGFLVASSPTSNLAGASLYQCSVSAAAVSCDKIAVAAPAVSAPAVSAPASQAPAQ